MVQAELLSFDLRPISEVGQLPRSGSWTWRDADFWEEAGKEREQDWRELLLSSELIAACSPPAWSSLCFLPAGLWHSQRKLLG